jgi:extradiol dioxygenase family protein
MIDHVAHPSFDVAATHRFYSEVLGARLKAAFSGDSSEWNARYVCDPNGLIIEFSVAEAPAAERFEALDVVRGRIATAQSA